jgi:predicted transcriptional regulator
MAIVPKPRTRTVPSRTTKIDVRLDSELVELIDFIAEAWGTTRTAVVAGVLEQNRNQLLKMGGSR